MSNEPTGKDRPEHQLVPLKRRKTRLIAPHKTGILVPPWWRTNRALALLALSVIAVIGAIVVIGGASERVAHLPDAAETPGYGADVEEPDDLAHYHEEPLPGDVYEGAPVVVPSNPEDGVLHIIEDPGAQVRGERIGELIEQLGLDEPSDTPELPDETTPDAPQESEDLAVTTKSEVARISEFAEEPIEDAREPASEIARLRPSQTGPAPTVNQSVEDAVPAWIRHALPFEPVPDKPLIAIVIDDVGVSRRHSATAINLPGPLTMSFLTYADDVNEQAQMARDQGHEVMLHVPMEPSSETIDPGPNALFARMPEPEIRNRLTWAMRQLDSYVGINNHMGSRFTQDRDGMRTVLETISRSGHYFLDSRTSGGSVAGDIASDLGMPFASRNVFLDHEDDQNVIRRQLAQAEPELSR